MTTFILRSDTIVYKGCVILEKFQEWTANGWNVDSIIRFLAWDSVHTGVAIYKMNHNHKNNDDGNEFELLSSFTVTAKVKFAQLSEQDIHAYVKTGEPMDKVGSYGIQGIGGQMIECM